MVDVDKAYDSVCHDHLLELCTHMGIADCALFRLMWQATTTGGIHVTGSQGLAPQFSTSRGIKQGCPFAPILFGLLMSGLERYLLDTCSTSTLTIANVARALVNYADDL